MRDATLFVLTTQYVEWAKQQDVHFHVVLGSGMGMRHSGSVSVAAFYANLERNILSRSSELGLELFAHFSDDILACVSEPRFCLGLREALASSHDGFPLLYRVELESFSLQRCNMLDMTVFKTVSSGMSKLAFKPYIKPSAMHVSLGARSCHAQACHLAWPTAEVRRMH